MVRIPLKSSTFSLDSSGVAGFFGGDEAVSAMGVVHLYEGRRWLGWYNAPGSYEIARKYGQLARARFWDGLFPGPNVEPEVLFELDGEKGPSYKAWHSGTNIAQTGHIGYLFLKECEEVEAEKVNGRITRSCGVTIVDLQTVPECTMRPPPLSTNASVIAAIPMLASIAACVLCGVFEDWYSFSMILLGIICSGISCFVIGSGELEFSHPKHAQGSPKGDGVLMDENEVVVLLGTEGAVNSVTRGKFSLKFDKWFHSLRPKNKEPKFRSIGFCSLLLIAQFLAQLLLIPQGELFGQIMFLGSLGVSWGYNLYLSSLDKEVIQRQILKDHVLRAPKMKRYTLGTRTTMAVFLALMYDKHRESPITDTSERRKERLMQYLSDIIPNETAAWSTWRNSVADRISLGQKLSFDETDWNGAGGDVQLLEFLYGDANTAQEAFSRYEAYASSTPTSTLGSSKTDTSRKRRSIPEQIRQLLYKRLQDVGSGTTGTVGSTKSAESSV